MSGMGEVLVIGFVVVKVMHWLRTRCGFDDDFYRRTYTYLSTPGASFDERNTSCFIPSSPL